MASSLKITETFSIAAPNGDLFNVNEHTRCETGRVDGVKREILGRSFFKTEDGRGVLKKDDGTYTIPSLGITAKRSS